MMSLFNGENTMTQNNIQDENKSISCNASSYIFLLNSLASDLDCMLNELCDIRPQQCDHYQRNNVFLEPYLQNGSFAEVDDSPDTSGPNPLMYHQLSHLHNVQSSESLSSESESSLQVTSTAEYSESQSDSGSEVACDITLIERLIRSHPIWFLPGIQRAGAFHLLQGKEEGNFVVRQSSQNDTMALSVRLPPGKGPYIEHYLIQANNGKLSLETSDNRFDNIPSLIAHYSHCCDELPVQLKLPRAMREAKNRQQLSSLALLGQEFWRYPMAIPKPLESQENSISNSHTNSSSNSSNTSSLSSFHTTNELQNDDNNCENQKDKNIVLNLVPISSEDSILSSKSKPVVTEILKTCVPPRLPRPTPPNTLNLKHFNEPLDIKEECSNNIIILPSEKPLKKLISPNLVKNIRCRSPIENNVIIPNEFKNNFPGEIKLNNIPENDHESCHYNIKTPPTPPPRWAKPGQNNICISTLSESTANTSMTTMSTTTVVKLNVEQTNTSDTLQQVLMSNKNITKLVSPPSINSNKSISSNFTNKCTLKSSNQVLSPTTKLIAINGIKTPILLSPITPSGTSKSRRRRATTKTSQHYQECDLLESYCRSSPADKISDYEDIWNSTDRSNWSWSPHELNSPTQSQHQEQEQQQQQQKQYQQSPPPPAPPQQNLNNEVGTDRIVFLRNDKFSKSREKLSYMEIASPEFSSFKPFIEAHSSIKSPKIIKSPDKMTVLKHPDLLSRIYSANSLNCSNTQTVVTPVKNNLSFMFTKSESNSPLTPESKQSPFYAEPADAIQQYRFTVSKRRHRSAGITSRYRHSEPGWFQNSDNTNTNQTYAIDWNETEDKIPLISSSVDNLSKRFSTRDNKKLYPRAKPVQPPKVKSKVSNDTFWTVDSSWEFIGNEKEENGDDDDSKLKEQNDYESKKVTIKFDNLNQTETNEIIKSKSTINKKLENEYKSDDNGESTDENAFSVQNIIFQRYPELLKSSDMTKFVSIDRNSSYDNVEIKENIELTPSNWENERKYNSSELDITVNIDGRDKEQMKRSSSFKDKLDSLLAPPRLQALKNREMNGSGSSIRAYAILLATDKTTTFSQNIDNFIQCTMEGKEASPHIVMRNIRQFMSGMKNYLVKHGEKEFEKEVEKERIKLKANEFLNLDAILEGVMMKLVVRPLREHVYKLFVEHYGTSGSLKSLADNIQYAYGKHIQELGVRPTLIPPSDNNLNIILKYIELLQKSDSPLDKLENLLSAISAIFNSVKYANCEKHITLGADDLLPLLVWVLVRGKVIDAEIEAEFMWGLLHPSLLTGEGGYYLTTLSSAVHVLKTFKTSQGTMSTGSGTPECCSSVLRVLIPDEFHGSLNTRTLPVRPNMNTRDICRILAHKIHCTNPQDYGLFKLVQGEETLLGDQDCPQELSHCLFAYKRIDAKIAWPKTTS